MRVSPEPSTIAERRPRSRLSGFAIVWLQGRFGSKGGGGIAAMKTFTVAVAMLAVIAIPAHAQMGSKRPQTEEKKPDTKTKKADENAYKAALEKIPEPKEKYDPWGIARPADSAKKSK